MDAKSRQWKQTNFHIKLVKNFWSISHHFPSQHRSEDQCWNSLTRARCHNFHHCSISMTDNFSTLERVNDNLHSRCVWSFLANDVVLLIFSIAPGQWDALKKLTIISKGTNVLTPLEQCKDIVVGLPPVVGFIIVCWWWDPPHPHHINLMMWLVL